ncbi:hypothetical protein BC828DRAFT_392074 [Blastocladiella britannica]|nr:hypothetical protein BC828DRAFT_392074 [Blastocladiella britannica]
MTLETNMATDLYEILGVARDADADAIKKSYRKLALLHHPDRHSAHADESQATAAKALFQHISLAYSILSDAGKRKRYDTSGRTEDLPGLAGMDGANADAYFADLYDSCVTVEAIEEFRKEYQGSAEEVADVLAAYAKHAGAMDLILSEIVCSTTDDEDRFRVVIDAAIAEGKVPAHAAHTHENPAARAKRKRDADDEAAAAEEMARELGLTRDAKRARTDDGGDDDLAGLQALIRQNQSRRAEKHDDFMAKLEAKYADDPKKSSRATAADDEEDDEEQEDEEEEEEDEDDDDGSDFKGSSSEEQEEEDDANESSDDDDNTSRRRRSTRHAPPAGRSSVRQAAVRAKPAVQTRASAAARRSSSRR